MGIVCVIAIIIFIINIITELSTSGKETTNQKQ
jgi:hypothetical protein